MGQTSRDCLRDRSETRLSCISFSWGWEPIHEASWGDTTGNCVKGNKIKESGYKESDEDGERPAFGSAELHCISLSCFSWVRRAPGETVRFWQPPCLSCQPSQLCRSRALPALLLPLLLPFLTNGHKPVSPPCQQSLPPLMSSWNSPSFPVPCPRLFWNV